MIAASRTRSMQPRCALLGAALAVGCTAPPSVPAGASAALVAPSLAAPSSSVSHFASLGADRALAEGNAYELVLDIRSRAVLSQLERTGFDIRSVAFSLTGEAAGDGSVVSNAELSTESGYASVVQTLTGDLHQFRQRDPLSGVGMRYGHRTFDPGWLRSPAFHFQLAGIVNRIDRRAFDGHGCGQLRFLYRLTYTTLVEGQTITSRVPMTVNVVRRLPLDDHGGCAQHAARWQRPTSTDNEAAWLVGPSGPLHELHSRTSLRSVEVNLQSVRWPSTLRPNMAGHAEYLMRVFSPTQSGEFVPTPLENTPDVLRLTNDAGLRSRFVAWLQAPDTLAAIDQGTVVMPDEFAAHRVVSVAPHGLARLGNRPFTQLANPLALRVVDAGSYTTFTSPATLLRRLDGLSCSGCHQTRSVAGFHFLGDDDPSRQADVIAVPHSPHFQDELVRRRRYLTELFAGRAPDELRLPAERMGSGDYGSHCGLMPEGEYSAWTCETGLRCTRLDDAEVGSCLPTQAGPGDACEFGRITANANAHRDFVALEAPSSCGSGHCERSAVGFPGGMCSQSCSSLPETARCGGIARLTEFNSCLARQIPFETCIADSTRPGALRRCSLTDPCREDYICARLSDGSGGCIPPYFLFQMRVDGHVLP